MGRSPFFPQWLRGRLHTGAGRTATVACTSLLCAALLLLSFSSKAQWRPYSVTAWPSSLLSSPSTAHLCLPHPPLHPLRLRVLTAVNGVDRHGFLCHFFRSALWHQVPVTVLGWDRPELANNSSAARPRPRSALSQLYTQEFYLGSKIVLLRRLIQQEQYGHDDLLLLTDSTDAILQHPLHTLEAMLAQLLSPSNYSLVLTSAERDVWPPSFTDKYSSFHSSEVYQHHRRLLNATGTDRAEAFYSGLNGGTFIGRASLLLRLLDELAQDRAEYAEHHLVYNAEGRIIAGGEQRVVIPGPLLHPDTLQLVDEYVVPGVYKRNEQISWSLLYLSQSEQPERRPFPIVIDESAFLFQTMQLTSSEARERLQRAVVSDSSLGARLRALPWWKDSVWQQRPPHDTTPMDDIVAMAAACDERLMTREASPHVPLLVHYNGPSKFRDGFDNVSFTQLTSHSFYAQERFMALATPHFDVARVRQQTSSGGLFRFIGRDMASISTVDVSHLCPAIFGL